MDYHDPMEPFTVPPELNRRLAAAGIDIAVVLLCCIPPLLAAFPMGLVLPISNKLPLIVLALVAALEIFTGQTIGKLIVGLRIRRENGPLLPVGLCIARGIVRLIPVALALLSIMPSDPIVRMILLFAAITLGLCYFSACYFSIFRRGRTTFDLIVHSATFRARSPSAQNSEATGT